MDTQKTDNEVSLSPLYEELTEILSSARLVCDDSSAGTTAWYYDERVAVQLKQGVSSVVVVFSGWVLDKLLFEAELPHACPSIVYTRSCDFRLLCHQLYHAFLLDESAGTDTICH